MIVVSLRFLAGRYHATPWGRHVNEGVVDWPPSPWRILRSLVAVWKRTLPELGQREMEPILRGLATPPEFVLPPASTGHTRHYMPWDKGWKHDKQHPLTLVFDSFVAVSRDAALLVRWPDVSLSDAQRATLTLVLANLNTFGRSESWCEASLGPDTPETGGLECRPVTEGVSRDHEIVRVLCPDPASAFADDHAVQTKRRATGRGKNRQIVEERSTIYDPAWNLCMETLQLHREKWSDPPGSRWISYARPRECFKIERTRRSRRPGDGSRIQVVRYVLDSAVLPLVTETLPVAEIARRALIRIYIDARGRAAYGDEWSRDLHRAGLQPVPAPCVFLGKDDSGWLLKGHRHAYYLPTDEDGDGRLDHLTIYAADGFDLHHLRALDRLRELRTDGRSEQRQPLRLLLLWMGTLDKCHTGPLRPSCEWVSGTPYVAARYAKTRGRKRVQMTSPEATVGFLADDLRTQLAVLRPELRGESGLAPMIEPLLDDNRVFRIATRWRPIQFKRFRQKYGDDGGRRLAGAFRIRFQAPVSGPIALGHSSHFGLGLFHPADDAR